MNVEFNPGRFHSATNTWYFACDGGPYSAGAASIEGSALIGLNLPPCSPKPKSTLTVVGFALYYLDSEHETALNLKSKRLTGGAFGGLYSCSRKTWLEVIGEDLRKEWATWHTDRVVYITTDSNYIVRLHFAFE
jgi:hypothetical protein